VFVNVNIRIKTTLGTTTGYASRANKRPSSANFTWRGNSASTQDINILAVDKDFGLGTLYIAVYATTVAKFTITATLNPV